MSEETQIQEELLDVPLDDPSVSQEEFKKARSEGVATVEKKASELPEDDQTEEQKPKKNGGGFQRKINSQRKEIAELRRQLEERNSRASSHQEEQTQEEEQEQEETSPQRIEDLEPEPKGEYPTTAEMKAHAAWQERKMARKNAETWAKLEADRQAKSELVAQFPDWNKVVDKSDLRVRILPSAGKIVTNLPISLNHKVVYYLGKHPDQCKTLHEMGMNGKEQEQAEEILRLSNRLLSDAIDKDEEIEEVEEQEEEVTEQKSSKSVSKAPTPIKALSGGSTTQRLPLDDPRVSMKEFKRRRANGESR